MSSSWIDSICPIFSAAPLILQSALANLAAFASLRTPLGASEGGPSARLTVSVATPHTSPAPSPANPSALPILEDGTARSRNVRFLIATGGSPETSSAGAASAATAAAAATSASLVLCSGAGSTTGGEKGSPPGALKLALSKACAGSPDVAGEAAWLPLLSLEASWAAASSSSSTLVGSIACATACEALDTGGIVCAKGIGGGGRGMSGRCAACVEKRSWLPCTAVYPYMTLTGDPGTAADVVNALLEGLCDVALSKGALVGCPRDREACCPAACTAAATSFCKRCNKGLQQLKNFCECEC
jgi:hypothetical protein